MGLGGVALCCEEVLRILSSLSVCAVGRWELGVFSSFIISAISRGRLSVSNERGFISLVGIYDAGLKRVWLGDGKETVIGRRSPGV